MNNTNLTPKYIDMHPPNLIDVAQNFKLGGGGGRGREGESERGKWREKKVKPERVIEGRE